MTDAELAILSIVAEGPVRGHALQTIIDKRGLRDWTNIGTSSMYYVLQKLAHQGLLESTGDFEEPTQREYRITPAGYGVLQTAVVDLLSTPHKYADGLGLGLANLHVLRPEQIRTALHAYRQNLAAYLAQNREQAEQLQTNNAPINVWAIFDRHATLLETELTWIIHFIEEWEAQAPPDEPRPTPEPVDIPRMKQVILPHDDDSPHRVPTRSLHSPPKSPPLSSEAPTDLSLTVPPAKTTALSRTTPPERSITGESAEPAENNIFDAAAHTPTNDESDPTPPLQNSTG